LKGLVSKSLIHECLPAKYKQKHRIDNAKKQKKKKIQKEPTLAPLSALNPRIAVAMRIAAVARAGSKADRPELVGLWRSRCSAAARACCRFALRLALCPRDTLPPPF